MSKRSLRRSAYEALEEADSYAQWGEAALAIDRLSGAEAWREQDDSPHYDAGALKQCMATWDRMIAADHGLPLAEVLSADLYRHLTEVGNPALYEHALSGPKHLVGRFLESAERALIWLSDTPIRGVSAKEKNARFSAAYKVFGRSALMLSGGATLGFHHLGVVKALFDEGLLPHILSGASTGAMIAAGVCTRSDADIAAMFADIDSIRRDGLKMVGPTTAWKTRALLDPSQLYEVIRNNVGELTFAEAYAQSGRALNIVVAPTRTHQKPRLLTHLTAPDVLVASAALASSALPVLFPPVVLEAQGRKGDTVEYIPSERWVDGSLSSDLPKLRLSRLHNVNHFIVSQTNPHVLPFVRHHGRRGIRPAIYGLASSALRTQGAFATDVVRRLNRGSRGPLRQLGDRAYALVSQDYTGDIDIHPQFRWDLYRKAIVNPSRDDLCAFIKAGERSAWPKLELLRNQTRISRTFRSCITRLAKAD